MKPTEWMVIILAIGRGTILRKCTILAGHSDSQVCPRETGERRGLRQYCKVSGRKFAKLYRKVMEGQWPSDWTVSPRTGRLKGKVGGVNKGNERKGGFHGHALRYSGRSLGVDCPSLSLTHHPFALNIPARLLPSFFPRSQTILPPLTPRVLTCSIQIRTNLSHNGFSAERN